MLNYRQNNIDELLKNKDLSKLESVLNTFSGFEIADIINDKSSEEQLLAFSLLSPKLAAETIDYLTPRVQKEILHSLTSMQTAKVLRAMRPDDRTALLEEFPRDVVDEYLKLLPNQERYLTLTLLGYPEDSVGRIMTTDYIAVKFDWTIEQVLDHIRAYGHDSETIDYIFVVDDNDLLIDDIKIKDFLFYPKEQTVLLLLDKRFIALYVLDKAENAINTFKKHNRVALPVIDEEGTMLGVVTIDDILRLSSKKNTSNIQKIGGTEALDEPYMETPFMELMKKRARWLVLIFLGEMFTATAMGFYENEISKAVVLALFLPLIISSGGNAGSQSSTLIIRAMALGEVRLRDWLRIMRREICSGLFLGLILGFVGFARISIWSLFSTIYGPHWLLVAFTIGTALIGVVLWGSFTGAMLPLLLRRCKVDPATSSAPLVATIVDVTGIIIYFGIAMAILQGTLL